MKIYFINNIIIAEIISMICCPIKRLLKSILLIIFLVVLLIVMQTIEIICTGLTFDFFNGWTLGWIFVRLSDKYI
jgi:hypothetical protein